MRISEQGIALIRRYEGFSEHPYQDASGKWTIGYGHLIRAGETFPPEGITLPQAEALLKRDIASAEQAVRRMAEVPLAQGQFDALVSFIFNAGAGAFARSTLRRLVNQRRFAEAADEFPKWAYANGRMLPGLAARRRAERAMFLASF